MTCNVFSCESPIFCKGYCTKHYQKLKKYGDPLAGVEVGAPRAFAEAAAQAKCNECITWPFHRTRGGYGSLRVNGQNIAAHRYVLMVAKGAPADDSLLACHDPVLCNNPCCINPEHLRWASASENEKDKRKAGTLPLKFSDEIVKRIREDERPYSQISKEYGVSITHISNLKRGLRRAA